MARAVFAPPSARRRCRSSRPTGAIIPRRLAGGSGGAINIVSKSGTNAVHGSVFLFARNEVLDAGDPFARVLQGSNEVRIKPPSKRQQFGATLGMPLRRNHMFLFASFEGLRRESSVASILTDNSIFGPTPQQEAFLTGLPADRFSPAVTSNAVSKSDRKSVV